MKKLMKSVLAAMFGFAALILVQPDHAANARGGGMGGHSFHMSGHFRPANRHFAHHHHNQNQNQNQNLWWYGGYGYYTLPASTSGDDAATSSVPVMYVPVHVASCHKVQEAMTVPSEEGGTRQVTVTRCQ